MHVKRRLFNLLAAVSLVLCVAITAAMIQSFWFHRGYLQSGWDRDRGILHQNGIDVFGGCVQFTALRVEVSESLLAADGISLDFSHVRRGHSINAWRSWFWFDGSAGEGPSWLFGLNVVRIPLVLPALLTSAVPWLWYRRRCRAHLDMLHNRCPACGYNLTGNVSGACPECGNPVAAKQVTGAPA